MKPVLIFDLDDTLHSTPALAQAYAELAGTLLADRLHLTPEEGVMRLRAEQARLSAAGGSGYRATMSQSLLSLGVSLTEWVEARDARMDPAPFIRPDEALRQRLRLLAKHYTLALLTNNSRCHTEAIARALGIRDLFGSRVFTVSEILLLKPDPEVFLRICRELGASPEQCISVGDRLSVDVEPARQLGMRGILVDPPGAIYAVMDSLLAEAQEASEARLLGEASA